jgi:type VI secretion system protein ImpC
MTDKATEQAQEAAAAVVEDSLLESIISRTRVARSDDERKRTRDLIGEFVREALEGTVSTGKHVVHAIEERVQALDEAISKQLNAVMHAQAFQKLEASWRGLHYLVMQSETGTGLKINVLNATKAELVKDFQSSPEFDQSALWKKVYDDEYGMFGGAPYSALVGNFEFGRHPQDMYLLEEISHVAAAAHAPFISAASPELFGWDSFTELSGPRDLAKLFETAEYAKWRSFRNSDDSRYVALTLPHVLARLPYGKANVPVEAFNFEEDVSGKEHNKYLWTNAAFALGTRITDAAAKHGWCAAIRGVEGGGLVSGLPTHTFETDEGDIALKCPTEIAITERREKELADLGLVPLVHCKGTDYAAFFSTQSANKAKSYDTDAANANARLSSQLQYIMAVSRFAHYLKAMMRDKIGSFATRGEISDFLNRWIRNYVTEDDNASFATKAQYPLREARVDVTEVPGKPGVYRAVAFLRPHFQLDELTISMRLVAELPKQAAA